MREKVKANSTSQSLPVFLLCLLLAGCSTPEKPAGEAVVEPPMVQESEALTRETQEAEQPETQASDSDTPPLVLSAIAATGRMPATMMAHTRSAMNLVTKEFFKSMSSLTTE